MTVTSSSCTTGAVTAATAVSINGQYSIRKVGEARSRQSDGINFQLPTPNGPTPQANPVARLGSSRVVGGWKLGVDAGLFRGCLSDRARRLALSGSEPHS